MNYVSNKKGVEIVMKKILFIVLAVVIASWLFLAGCGEPTPTTTPTSTPTATPTQTPTATPTQKYGGTLRILDMRLPAGSVGWPAKMAAPDTYFLNPGIETLFRALMDGTMEPLLATGYNVASDKSSVTITLRQGVKFQDGTDFNAEAAKFNLEAVMAGKVAGTTGWTSVEVIDPYTVKINIGRWENLLLGSLSGIAGMMVSPTAIKTNGEEWALTNMVTTAPFKLTKFERDTIMEYTRFDDYWQEGKPYLDKIQYICMPDMVNQVTTFKVGDADLVQPWNGMVLSQLQGLPDTEFIYNDSGVFVIYPDDANADSPLSKKEVRMAIEYAIDKASLMKVSGFGIFDAAYQVPCRGGIGYIEDLPKRMYDPDKAKQLLADAGYPNGFETTLTITIPAPDIKDAQVALQEMLAKVGITCNLEYADPAKYAEYMDKGWHNTMIYSPAYAAGNFLSSVQTYYMLPGFYVSLKGPANLKELYDAALSTPEVDRAMVEKVTRALYEDCSLIPVSYMGTGQVFKNYVHDTGFGVKYASQMVWTPENVWMSN
jgi:peptide/nickel transport system substrate-binding protein